MNKEQVEYAERQALKLFDEWNDVTGCFEPGIGSWYSELVAVIKDAVHCGIQTAIFGDVKIEDGEVVRYRVEKLDDKAKETEQFLNDLSEFEEKSKQTSIRVKNRLEREKRLEDLGFENTRDQPFSIGSFPEQLNFNK